MKKILFIVLMILTGCRSFDVFQAGIPESNPSTNLLPHLTINLPKTRSESEATAFLYYRRMFEDNLMSTTGTIQGTVDVIPKFKLDKSEDGWKFFSCITLGLLNLVGFPVGSWTGQTILEVQLKNSNKEIVKKFYANVKHTEYIALYKYNDDDAKKAAYLNSFRMAVDKIADQVKLQAKKINFKVKNSKEKTYSDYE